MALADIFRNLYGNRFSALPADINRSFGGQSINALASALMNNPTLMGGLSQGMFAGEQIFDKGTQEHIKRGRETEQFGAQQAHLASQMESEQLSRERLTQLMNMSEEDAVRKRIDQEQQDIIFKQGQTERSKKIATGMTMAEEFGNSPEEKALYSALAEAGMYSDLFDTIAVRELPSVEHWDAPYAKPGVGLVQVERQTGQMRVLHHEPSESGSGFGMWGSPQYMPGVGIVQQSGKGKFSVIDREGMQTEDKYKPNPEQIGKLKIKILENQLIPEWRAKNPEPGMIDKIKALVGGGDEKPQPQMTQFGPYRIPASLLQQAEKLAVEQHVRLYKNAAEKATGRSAKGNKSTVPSLGGGPVKGPTLSDFSNDIALNNAVRKQVDSNPMYAGIQEDQKKQLVEQIVGEIKQSIDNGDSTYEEAIQMFLGGGQ